MKISSFSIIIIFIVLSITGVALLPKLSVSLLPNKTLPSISVSTSLNGASPMEVEKSVTSKLEASLSTIEGISKVSSTSTNGISNVRLDFYKDTDMDFARFEVANSIRNIYPTFPENTSFPRISLNAPDDSKKKFFQSYTLNADISPLEIQNIANNKIIPLLNEVEGIDQVDLSGNNESEILISYSENELAAIGLTKDDLLRALQLKYSKKQLGVIKRKNHSVKISIAPSIDSVNWHFPIKKVNSKIYYFDQLCTIKQKEKDPTFYQRINGESAITIFIYSQAGANQLELAKLLENKVSEIKSVLGNDIKIQKVYDSTTQVKQELDSIYLRTILTLIILLLFVIVISRNLKYVAIVFVSLFFNVLLAINLYYFLGIEIQLFSLAGITISLGMMIDNIVVVIDQEFNKHKGNIIIAILASTLTTIGALLAIFFLDDDQKLNLIDFALVIVINLATSVIISRWLVIALIDYFRLNKSKESTIKFPLFYKLYEKYITISLRYKKLMLFFAFLLFGIPSFMLPKQLDVDSYIADTYNKTIGNDFFYENIKPYIDKAIGGSFRLFSVYVFESNYYYKDREEESLFISARNHKGATIEQMNDVIMEMENLIKGFKGYKMFETNISSGQYASIQINFDKEAQMSYLPFLIKNRLIMKAIDLGGVSWSINGFGDGFYNSSSSANMVNYALEAKGYNYQTLNEKCEELAELIAQHPRIKEVKITANEFQRELPEQGYKLSFENNLIASQDLNISEIRNSLKDYTYKNYSDLNLSIDNKLQDIRFESMENKSFDIWNLQNQDLNVNDKHFKLNSLSSISDYIADEKIMKSDQQYERRLSWQYAGSEKFGTKHLNEVLNKFETQIPMGYSFKKLDRQWFFGEKEKNYAWVLALILIVVYFISAVTFESFLQPFAVISLIPLSFVGVFLTFYLFDFNFDQGAMASFILLSGITVNSTIFILNAYNGIKKEKTNISNISTYMLAFKSKINPILLTVISTIIGFIPFVYQGQNEVFWFALGAGSIGGLIMSLFVIVIFLPVILLKK
jgi:multidrug efflux pump subunit AcrB